MSQITIGAASDPGQKRKENQDSHAFRLPEEGSSHQKGILLALADGMGGQLGGGLASKVVVEVLPHLVRKEFAEVVDLSDPLAMVHVPQ